MAEIKPVYGRKPIKKAADTRKLTKPEEVKPIKTPVTRDVVLEAEDESGTTINNIKTVLTKNDITGLTPRPSINTPVTTATISYVVKKIPVPSTSNINVLSANSKIWNIPRAIVNQDTGDIEFYLNNENNYIGAEGKYVDIKVRGDNGAAFKLVVKDVTNSKWYNWETEEFESGYNNIESTVKSINRSIASSSNFSSTSISGSSTTSTSSGGTSGY